ncbi:MAG: glycosyltransferase family 2 protein [candidate division Zixibacteria bacterium]|nr:glycosyltransferase family 2 protein [candidate division Zixibacteria bacterium]MBU1470749.1 glycosyltransferase family 2 protein [candidate division Zixibacteria bacterium]MBU2624491.1 glycosyltransferase family 2 protein [candidate division Zixibacteria bacterium]
MRQYPPRRPRFSNRISIVVPAYNEAENIKPLIEKFAEMMRNTRLPAEVIIVDDGSDDQTLQYAQQEAHRHRFLRVLSHKRNQGLTAALETGFNAARGSILAFWPADLQYMPEDIPRMVAKIDDGYDVVCGWKKGRYGMKRFVSFFYNLLSRVLFRVGVHDLNSVKAFRREVYQEMPNLREGWHRYLVVMAADRGFKVGEVRVQLYPRLHGKTKFGMLRIPIGLTDLFSVKYRISFMRKPMLFFGSLGILLIVAAFAVGVVAIYFRVILSEGYRPLLYLVMLLAMSGLASVGLGFVAESLIYVQDEIAELKKQTGKIDSLAESISRLRKQMQATDKGRKRAQESSDRPQN